MPTALGRLSTFLALAKAVYVPILRSNGNNVRTVANSNPMLTNAITSRHFRKQMPLPASWMPWTIYWANTRAVYRAAERTRGPLIDVKSASAFSSYQRRTA